MKITIDPIANLTALGAALDLDFSPFLIPHPADMKRDFFSPDEYICVADPKLKEQQRTELEEKLDGLSDLKKKYVALRAGLCREAEITPMMWGGYKKDIIKMLEEARRKSPEFITPSKVYQYQRLSDEKSWPYLDLPVAYLMNRGGKGVWSLFGANLNDSTFTRIIHRFEENSILQVRDLIRNSEDDLRKLGFGDHSIDLIKHCLSGEYGSSVTLRQG